MASLEEYDPGAFVKLLLIGNSGAGKTGALTSLVPDYDLRIVDFDAGLRALQYHVKQEHPERLGSIQVNTFRDRMTMTSAGPKLAGPPRAYMKALNALEKWPDDGSDPASWGPGKILVLDSLTNAGRAAFQWARAMNPTSKDPRQWYKAAQDLIEDLIANLTDDNFGTNVIVISHVDMVEGADGITRGYTSAIGKALGPKIPRFFDTLILSELKGFGKNVKRKFKTVPTSQIDLKNPAPLTIEDEYPIETGLADIFKKLKT